MNLYGIPGSQFTVNQTLQPGHRPVQKLEMKTMVLRNPSILLDIAAATQREKIDQSIRRSMVAEAIKGGSPRIGIVRSLRRVFGEALIGFGHRVHGERVNADAAALPAANTLGLAR